MKSILAPIILLTLLFPSLALGGVRMVIIDDLVERNDIVYERSNGVPYTGRSYDENFGGAGLLDFVTYQDGVKHGLRVQNWQKDYGRQLLLKMTYKNGKAHGPVTRYHSNGNISMKGKFKNGQYDGIVVRYGYSNGTYWQGRYKNGKEHGRWTSFLKDGSINRNDRKWNGTWRNGVRVSD